MAKYFMHLEVNAYCTDVYIIYRNDAFCTYKDQNKIGAKSSRKFAFSCIFFDIFLLLEVFRNENFAKNFYKFGHILARGVKRKRDYREEQKRKLFKILVPTVLCAE